MAQTPSWAFATQIMVQSHCLSIAWELLEMQVSGSSQDSLIGICI
jgi:hypothetical protein